MGRVILRILHVTDTFINWNNLCQQLFPHKQTFPWGTALLRTSSRNYERPKKKSSLPTFLTALEISTPNLLHVTNDFKNLCSNILWQTYTSLTYKLNLPSAFTSHAFQTYLLRILKQCMPGRMRTLTCSQTISAVPQKYTPSPAPRRIHRCIFIHSSRIHYSSFLECSCLRDQQNLPLWSCQCPIFLGSNMVAAGHVATEHSGGCQCGHKTQLFISTDAFCGFCRGQHCSRVWATWNTHWCQPRPTSQI